MFYDIINTLIVIFAAVGCFAWYKMSKNTGGDAGHAALLIFGWGGAIILAIIEGLFYLVDLYI